MTFASSLLLAASVLMPPSPVSHLPRLTDEQAKKLLETGGKHWSVPQELRGQPVPQPGQHAYLWPAQDRIYELRRDARGRYSASIELRWIKPAGVTLPVSRAKGVRTHIYFVSWKDSRSTSFGNTRTFFSTERSGTFRLPVTGVAANEIQELDVRVMTNDRPGVPVANFLRLQFRTASGR